MTISKEERAELRADIRANCYPDVSGELTSLLDALDASDERIASLGAECQRLDGTVTRLVMRADKAADELKEAKARIAELEAAAQWRPMDTAPRDGSRVLVGNGRNSPVFARFIDRQWRSDERLGIVRPSHWLPIPALPEGGAK
jgi:hypothetical protein